MLPVAGPYLVTYYQATSMSTYPYAEIDYSQMTHIAHAFVWPNANGTLDTSSDFDFYPQLIQSAHAHGVKIVISLGGADGSSQSFPQWWPTRSRDPTS